jgi:hypothetical protein
MSDPTPSSAPSPRPAQPLPRASETHRAAGRSPGQGRPPWWLMLVLLGAVVLCLFFFGSSRSGTRLVTLELLLGACALSVGGLLGFLFGIPRTLTRDAPAAADAAEVAAEDRPGEPHRLAYQPSTNLEQVSDWLTKILIGVGLVEFGKASSALERVGARVQGQVGAGVPGADVLTQAVIIIFAITGFLASFLWTRIYYGAIQAGADNLAYEALRAQVSQQARNTAQVAEVAVNARNAAEALMRGEVGVSATGASSAPEAVPMETAAPAADTEEGEWPDDVRNRVNELRVAPRIWDSDPGAALFSASEFENGRTLSASVDSELGRGLVIVLRVERVSGPPLVGMVTFLLHPTFRNKVVHVPVKDGVAETKVYASGTFTAVAIADRGQTQLAYNLARLPNAPEWFLNS